MALGHFLWYRSYRCQKVEAVLITSYAVDQKVEAIKCVVLIRQLLTHIGELPEASPHPAPLA